MTLPDLLANVPTTEQLLPWIISALFGIITTFGAWLLKALIPAIKELRDRIAEMQEEHRKGHAAMVQAMLVLTFKVNNPKADVSDEASRIKYPDDERKV